MAKLMKTAEVKEVDKSDPMVLLASFWYERFRNAMVAKSPYTKEWLRYIDAYNGDYFKNNNSPDYKSNLVSNYIFSIIETIRPIMLDNDPKFQAVPRQQEGMDFSNDLHEAFAYEWDRETVSTKLFRELITTLRIGTSIFFMPWDASNKNIRAIPVNPFNFFPDPLATCMEDAEYVIYATYVHEGILKRNFPQLADKLTGGDVNYRELVYDNGEGARIDNQILTLEVWAKDYSFDEYYDTASNTTKRKMKYPNGRVLIVAPELNLVLSDKENPYNDGEFPFILVKDYDIPGKFWGEGEVKQLLSPQSHMNELNNAIVDNAKLTANVPWIIDKNSGIGMGKITSRPGLVIRKNPGTEVRRDQPPSMPAYVNNAVADLKSDMEQISGVFDTLKGNSETGVYTAQGILALQEAGQARIRLKVKLLEAALTKMGRMWFSRMRQFWKEDRWFAMTRPDGTYDWKKITRNTLDQDYDIRITAGSTIAVNRGAMLDLMVRLAQTMMPDGQPLVDREAVVQYLPEEVKAGLLKRASGQNMQMEQLAQQVQEIAASTEQGQQEIASVLEQLTGALEKVNSQILQLQDAHDKMIEKTRLDEQLNKAKETGYNEGYADAEKMTADSSISDASLQEDLSYDEEFLTGLSNLTDDELALLVEQNPELVELINSASIS